MTHAPDRSRAAVGVTVKSGWAAVVLLIDQLRSPCVVDSRRIELSDPANPEARQPYHAGFGTARSRGAERARLLRAVRHFGRRSVVGLLDEYKAAGHRLAGAGVVVGSLVDPERIANDHIRIHALEGRLFRGIVEDGLTRHALSCSVWRDRDLYAVATEVWRRPEPHVRAAVADLGDAVGGPWRVEQKLAAIAAWLVLAARGRRTRADS